MKQDLILSAIIPVYNTPEKYLTKCIQSIFAQTYTNFEVIIVDDGSVNDCAETLEALVGNDPRFQIFHKENQGVSSARNYGISHINGDVFTFVDADDSLEPNTWEIAISALIKSNSDCVVFSWCDHLPDKRVVSHYSTSEHSCSTHQKWEYMMADIQDGRIPNPFINPPKEITCTSEEFIEEIVSDNIFFGGGYPWNKLWRTASFSSSIPFYDESLTIYEDKLWVVKAASQIKSVTILSDLLYHYVLIPNSLTRKDADVIDRQPFAYQAYEYILDYLASQNNKTAYYKAAWFYFDFIYEDLKTLTDNAHRSSHKSQYRITKQYYKRLCKRIPFGKLNYPVYTYHYASWLFHHLF